MNRVYDDRCRVCRFGLKNLVTGCNCRETWSRVRARYTTLYLLFQNDKEIIRPFYASHRTILQVNCPRLEMSQMTEDEWGKFREEAAGLAEPPHLDNLTIDSGQVPVSRQQLLDGAIEYVSTSIYEKGGRKVIKILDVSKCLNRLEKWQHRQDHKYNLRSSSLQKRWLFATKWWKQYEAQAKVVYTITPTIAPTTI